MKKSTLLLLLVSAAFGAFAADIDLSKLPPPSTKTGVTYDKDIKPIFEASCLRCHGENKPKAGLRLDSLDGVLKGSKDGKVVTPGESAKSDLVIAISQLDPHMAMPPKPRGPRGGRPGGPGGPGGPEAGPGGPGGPGGPSGNRPPPKPLTPEQVGLVRAWIDQGAK